MGNEASRPSGPGGGPHSSTPSSPVPKKDALPAAYSMRVLVLGARKTGKTSLLLRLQGKPFPAQYTPTKEIQTATFSWTYKNTEDRTKIEVWDVVDRALGEDVRVDDDDAPAGIAPKGRGSESGDKLDAEHIDVYAGAHAAVVLFNPGDPRTWAYAQSALARIPSHMPVALLGNFRDCGDQQEVSLAEMVAFADAANAASVRGSGKNKARGPSDGRRVYTFETSMRDCYGLRTLYNYFNVPFLELKLALTRQELGTAHEEVAAYIEAQDYPAFKASLAPRPSSSSGVTSASIPGSGASPSATPAATIGRAGLPRTASAVPGFDGKLPPAAAAGSGSTAAASQLVQQLGVGGAGTAGAPAKPPRGPFSADTDDDEEDSSPTGKATKKAPKKKAGKKEGGGKGGKKAAADSEDDEDDMVAGARGSSAAVPAAGGKGKLPATGKPTAPAPGKAAASLDDIDLGGRSNLAAFLGDDSDGEPAQKPGAGKLSAAAERARIAAQARGKPSAPAPPASDSEEVESDDEEEEERARAVAAAAAKAKAAAAADAKARAAKADSDAKSAAARAKADTEARAAAVAQTEADARSRAIAEMRAAQEAVAAKQQKPAAAPLADADDSFIAGSKAISSFLDEDDEDEGDSAPAPAPASRAAVPAPAASKPAAAALVALAPAPARKAVEDDFAPPPAAAAGLGSFLDDDDDDESGAPPPSLPQPHRGAVAGGDDGDGGDDAVVPAASPAPAPAPAFSISAPSWRTGSPAPAPAKSAGLSAAALAAIMAAAQTPLADDAPSAHDGREQEEEGEGFNFRQGGDEGGGKKKKDKKEKKEKKKKGLAEKD